MDSREEQFDHLSKEAESMNLLRVDLTNRSQQAGLAIHSECGEKVFDICVKESSETRSLVIKLNYKIN